MTKDVFEFRINGEHVSPETVDLDDLVDVLADLREAIIAVAVSSNPRSHIALSLVNISEGSNRLSLKESEDALGATTVITSAVRDKQVYRLPLKSQKRLRNIWQTAKDTGWDSCEFASNGAAIGDAFIDPKVDLFPDERVYSGHTTVYGRCTRAGGERQFSAKLTLLDGTKKTVRLCSKAMAEELGHRLYQVVGLDGEATWSACDDELLSFKAMEISPYTDRNPDGSLRSITESFKSLATAASGRWDSVDPEEFVAEQRRD